MDIRSCLAGACFLLACGGGDAVVPEPEPEPETIVVTGISPTEGATTGGESVNVTGSGFRTGATVSFGGTAGTPTTLVSAGLLVSMTPPGPAGAVDVIVTAPDGMADTLAAGFTYVAPPPPPPPPSQGTISERHPGDVGIGSDASVLFYSGFESGFSGWSSYTQDPAFLSVVQDSRANGGSRLLRASVTRTQLASNPYISAQAAYLLPNDVDELYWRFYAQFEGQSAIPHHWVAVSAGNYGGGGAGQRPAGDKAFWFNVDPQVDLAFKFYVYWHAMRSWVCDDGSTDPGCAGYNGPTSNPYYGNNFDPANQTGFARDQWVCVEIAAKVNTPGSYDGTLTLWVDDQLAGRYATGTPRGRWLRENFFSHGQYFVDEQAFEGFDFRTTSGYGLNRVVLDSYYEKDTLDWLESIGVVVPEAQVSLYDDVVVATQRIGCKVAP